MQGIVIGNSHIVAIRNAYRRYKNRLNLKFSFINPELEQPDGGCREMGDILRSAVNDLEPEIIVSCIEGNIHNLFGLIEHPSRFDLVLPERTDLQADPTRELIPFKMIEQLFEDWINSSPYTLKALRCNHTMPIVHLESPPTIPNEKHIRKYPDAFREQVSKRGITPAIIRYKLWRLHSSIIRRMCEQYDILFLPVPPETQDERGMMVKRAWNPDPTHGNEWYGRKVLEQLADLIPKILDSS